MKGLISALRTLTVIRWPGDEMEDLSGSLPWFPLIGLLLGLILFCVGKVWTFLPFSPWPAGGAMLLVVISTYLTRGLHLDGLADWADSIGGFGREKRLAIMKDVSLGVFGGLALVLALMIKWVALERILSVGAISWIVPVMTISRGMLVTLMTTLPSARGGEGMAGAFVKGASRRHRFLSHILSLGVCIFVGPLGLVMFALAWVMIRIFGVRCRNQFGGITGDLLGMANEMLEIFFLIICALPGQVILCYTGWGWVFHCC